MNKKFIDSNLAALIIFAVSIIAIIVIIYRETLLRFDFSKLTQGEFFLITFLLTICGFLIFREIVMWYWKINRIVKLLEQIEENTRPIVSGGDEK